MKKIISIILVSIIGISIVPKTLINEKHMVLESTTSVYTKEEVDSLLSTIRTNITTNTNEITNIKSELTTLENSLSNYALKTSLNTTNSNIDNLSTIASSNASKITELENLYNQGDATAEDIAQGKTAIVQGELVTGTATTTISLRSETIYKAPSVRGGTYVGTSTYNIDLTNAAYIMVGVYTYTNSASYYYTLGKMYFSDDTSNWAGIGGNIGTVENGYGKGYFPVIGQSGTKELVIANKSGSTLWLDEVTVYYFE